MGTWKLLSMKQPMEEHQTLSGEDRRQRRRTTGGSAGLAPSQPASAATAQQVAPVREAPAELRELERYLVLALALVSASPCWV